MRLCIKKIEQIAAFFPRYFASGWMFWIPYLFAYFLYYLTRWPVNADPVNGRFGFDTQSHSIPSLLSVYWGLHTINIFLGCCALWRWFLAKLRQRCPTEGVETHPKLGGLKPFLFDLIPQLIPWFLLALIFYIPGVYLEWPSDPWEHLRRINEWRGIEVVGAHSTWVKATYFIPYSLLGWSKGAEQLYWLNFYNTGMCMLLCWQYYRLSRTCGLSERASMVLVIVQALLFGNNTFSFYRYYGISSSIFSQIAATAVIRIAIEFTSWTPQIPSTSDGNQPTSEGAEAQSARRCSFWDIKPTIQLAISLGCLILLATLSHPQGVLVAGMGIIGVMAWRASVANRAAVYMALLLVVLINLIFCQSIKYPLAIHVLYEEGYLNRFYGLSLFSPNSPAGGRMMATVGIFGVFNMLAACILLRRNHVIGWLTLAPFVLLSLPCVAVPLSLLLVSANGLDNVVTFQRFFFCIPYLFALGTLISSVAGHGIIKSLVARFARIAPHQIACAVSLALVLAVPASTPGFNRFWHSIMVAPNDSSLMTATESMEGIFGQKTKSRYADVITTKLSRVPLSVWGGPSDDGVFRDLQGPSSSDLIATIGRLKGILTYSAEELSSIRDEQCNLLKLTPADWHPVTPAPIEFTESRRYFGTLNTIANSAGKSAAVFTRDMYPICPTGHYRIAISVKSGAKQSGATFLAIAWYDREGVFLAADQTAPTGANSPLGWANNRYSYFGLVGAPAPQEWYDYSIRFGPGEDASAPTNAAFVRIGALLNYENLPDARALIANVHFDKVKPALLLGYLYSPTYSTSFASQAGYLSGHWSPQKATIDTAGIREIGESFTAVLNRAPFLGQVIAPSDGPKQK